MAISLITVILAALAGFTMNAVQATNELRARQAATQVATTAMAALGTVPATDLVTGRDSDSVAGQWTEVSRIAAVEPWLNSMEPVSDGSAVYPAGATATIPTSATTQVLNNISYSVQTVLGSCQVRSATSTDCVIGGTGTTHLRAVVAVTWTAACGSSKCSYATATLVNRDADPVFNSNRATPLVPPEVEGPGNQISTVGANVGLQLAAVQNTGVPPLTWQVTTGTLPTGLTLSASGLVTGSPKTPISNTPIQVTVTDAFGLTGTADFTWTVLPAPTITTPVAQTSTTADVVNLTVAANCQHVPCTYTLAAAPAGLTINAATGVITGTPTTPGVSPNVTVTVTDADNVTATTDPFTWTVTAAATIEDPAPLNATVGNTKDRALGYTCPTTTCTVTLLGTVPPGLGLSATIPNATNNTATTIPVAQGSGTVYIAGTVQANAVPSGTSRAYAPRVRITSGTTSTTSAPGNWTIFVRPTIGTVGTRNVTVGAGRNVAVAYTCANSPCVLTLANSVPGLGLSATSGVTTTNNTTTLTVTGTSGTVYINGRVSGTAVPTDQVNRAYAVSLTITDADLATATSSGTWTATRAPHLTNPGSQAIEPTRTLSLQMTADCPNGGCTWVAESQVPGSSTWTPITISTTGGITYTPALTGIYTLRVTVTDSDGVTDQLTFPMTNQNFTLSIPNQSSRRPGTYTLDVAALVRPVGAAYTYSLSGQPPWLTINATTGLLTATLTSSSTTDTSIRVVVRSAASTASTVTSNYFRWDVTS